MEPIIVQAAITGSLTTRAQNPHLPVTVDEIVSCAVSCWEEGAAIIALHAREDDGTPTQRVDLYAAMVEGIRSAGCDAILNVSTGSAGGRATGAERYACLSTGAEMGTFDSGSVNMGDRVFENSLPFLRDLAKAFKDHGVKPEIECFESGHIETARQLARDGFIDGPIHFQFVLGVRGGAPATISQMLHMVASVPANSTWSICGVGKYQLKANMFSLIAGGHARTGLEDNVFYSKGRLATNEELVTRLVRIANEYGRPIASPEEARGILGLDPEPVASEARPVRAQSP